LLAFFAQTSSLVRPLELGEHPPETRAVALLRFRAGPEGGDDPTGWERARKTLGLEAIPEDLKSLAAGAAANPTKELRGLVGTFWPAMLDSEVAKRLFAPSHAGNVPFLGADRHGYILQPLERDAACRQIFVAGTDAAARARAESLVRELRTGADFAQVARERSQDVTTALRGGDLGIFERGRRDVLLRAAAFGARVGEIVGPVETPLGFHILQRVGVDAVSPRLRDDAWARVRGILIAFAGAQNAPSSVEREHDEAESLAAALAARIRSGEDMASLAAEFDDDRDGRARRGDLGWVRRGVSDMPQFFDTLFQEPPGELLGPIATRAGFVLLRREDPGPRTRFEVRKSALADMLEWTRTKASDDATTPQPESVVAAVAASRAFFADDARALAVLAPALDRCTSAAELDHWCARLPEPTREIARRFSRTLVAMEPWFLAEVWPTHERDIESRLGPLRERAVALGDAALELILSDYGIEDPRCVASVLLVHRAASECLANRTDRGGIALVGLEDSQSLQIEAVLRGVAQILDATSVDSVLAGLRRARPEVAAHAVERLHLIEGASIVRRLFDPAHPVPTALDAEDARRIEVWLRHTRERSSSADVLEQLARDSSGR
jgi:parvulin-like peptidyl-prolyl isomerase